MVTVLLVDIAVSMCGRGVVGVGLRNAAGDIVAEDEETARRVFALIGGESDQSTHF
jgi:hypothetical protein